MSHKPPATASAESEVDELVRRLNEVHDAISHARALGVPAPVPDALYRVCKALVDAHGDPQGNPDGSYPKGSMARSTRVRSVGDVDALSTLSGSSEDLAHKVPLRQLLWQVITPGEEFTVADVTERLASLGVAWQANKVSNALGYWVARHRLDRCRKGVYLYPEAPIVDEDFDDDVRRESPSGLTSRATPEAGRKEHHPGVPTTETRQAM